MFCSWTLWYFPLKIILQNKCTVLERPLVIWLDFLLPPLYIDSTVANELLRSALFWWKAYYKFIQYQFEWNLTAKIHQFLPIKREITILFHVEGNFERNFLSFLSDRVTQDSKQTLTGHTLLSWSQMIFIYKLGLCGMHVKRTFLKKMYYWSNQKKCKNMHFCSKAPAFA